MMNSMINITIGSWLLMMTSFGLKAQQWVSDYGQAQQIAHEQNKNIVLVFSGSDWCGPCIKLDKEVWSTEEFQAQAKDHFVMLKADFPRKKQNQLSADQQAKNNQLAERYNRQGSFPLVVLINPQGGVMGKTGYKRLSPLAYFEHLKKFE